MDTHTPYKHISSRVYVNFSGQRGEMMRNRRDSDLLCLLFCYNLFVTSCNYITKIYRRHPIGASPTDFVGA